MELRTLHDGVWESDIFAFVVRFLGTADSCAAASACTRWREGVGNFRSSLDLGSCGRFASREALLALAARCRARSLTTLQLECVRAVDDDVLAAFAPKLTAAGGGCHVDISSCTRVTPAGLELLASGSGAGVLRNPPLFDERSWRLFAPSPALSPSLVVRLQLLALSAARHPADKVAAFGACFSFASPANKRGTGPASRFAVMIMHAFPEMVLFSRFRVSRLWQEHEHPASGGEAEAVALVHLDMEGCGLRGGGLEGQIPAFEWRLRRLRATRPLPDADAGCDVAGCWMTDSVGRLPSLRRESQDAELHSSARGEWYDRTD